MDSGEVPPLPESVFEEADSVASETIRENISLVKQDGEIEISTVPFMQFRGANNNPVFKNLTCRDAIFDKEPLWKTSIPGEGVSSPIIVKDRVIVTSADGSGESRLHTAAYALANGQKIWQRTLKATGSLLCFRPFSSVAANTPASDGKYVVALFSSNDLVCFTLEGDLVWYRALGVENPDVVVSVGLAASPLIVDKTLVVQCQSNAASFAEAMDLSTGKTLWKIERPKGQGWASPTPLTQRNGSQSVVFVDRTGCTIHSLRTGEKLAGHEMKCGLTTSPVCIDDTVYFTANGITALRFDASSKSQEILWNQSSLTAGSPSLLVDGDNLYFIKSPGILQCVDRHSGDTIWQTRLSGSFYATPVIIGDHLIALSQQGMMYHVLLNEAKGNKLEDTELGEEILGSPALSERSVLIRSKKSLLRFDFASEELN